MNTINNNEQETTYTIYYKIAGHLMSVQFPADIHHHKCLSSFIPFETPLLDNEKTTLQFKLTLDRPKVYPAQTKLLSDLSIVWGDRFRFEESEAFYITSVNSDRETSEWNMFSSKDFKTSTIYVLEAEIYVNNVLSWLLMVAFGQAILAHDTLMIHASAVEKEDEAYAFLGKSGTGKSTHSRLWIDHHIGFNLLNDDNPAIRILEDDRIMIYGTPWSGKTPCYRNIAVPLKGIIRLHQAPKNGFELKKGIEAFIALLPSCSSIRWNRALFSHMNNTVQRMVQLLPIGYLNCLPNQEAVEMAYQEIRKEKLKTLK
ncbi:hypothetical protein OKW96_05860 [Sphingobacterium sp. KU25419]|nr:hypothetical protein OKW96_05860 [Sphingobacterium sp. KU25419]